MYRDILLPQSDLNECHTEELNKKNREFIEHLAFFSGNYYNRL